MHPLVLLQVALLRKPFVAVAARERLLSVVREDVNIQRALLDVVLIAIRIRTGEQFPLRVVLHMLRQGGCPLETFATNRTEIGFANHIPQLAGVLPVVLGKVGTFRKRHTTDFADVRFIDQMSTGMTLLNLGKHVNIKTVIGDHAVYFTLSLLESENRLLQAEHSNRNETVLSYEGGAFSKPFDVLTSSDRFGSLAAVLIVKAGQDNLCFWNTEF